MKPKHIILLRHGESQANVDTSILHNVPDHKIELSALGREQALQAGKQLRQIIGDSKVLFYVSPYKRARQTFEQAKQAFSEDQLHYYIEPRLREQDFGNFQDPSMATTLKLRSKYGRFFYRFPEGESGADVYDRISTFLETIYRAMERNNEYEHIVIVSHGLTIRLFLMRWFRWTVEEFESYENPSNCEYYIMELCGDNKKLKYYLKSEMKKFCKRECSSNTIRDLIPPLVYCGIACSILHYFSRI